MRSMNKGMFRSFISAALMCAVLCVASVPVARANSVNNDPDLPSPVCDGIAVQPGNSLLFRAYAVGVQRYRWNGASWDFVEPVATLYADANYNVKLGVHYAGPTWESVTGGKVVATRVAGCTPDPTAIPWLLLKTVSTSGPGIMNLVTYIQRVNTKGGLTPTAPGASTGAIADVPYTTEYYFYRASN
jgi:hypothetical protein